MPEKRDGVYYFTQAELDELEGYYNNGNWSVAYNRAAQIIGSIFPEPDAITQAKLWFEGAHFVNTNQGAFSDLIRYYTQRQGQLHFGASVGMEIFLPMGVRCRLPPMKLQGRR